MTSTPLLDTLQAQPWPAALWRADQLARSPGPTCPSGFARLDAELPGGGWPQGSLIELLLAGPGQGEWRLLAPVLARLSQGSAGVPGRELICIGQPVGWWAHGPGLAPLGLALPRLLWVDAPDLADGAWAAEQALRSGSCAAVIWWAWPAPPALRSPQRGRSRPDSGSTLSTHLRRLHLAAQAGHSLLWVLRPLAAATQSSPAPLRLSCQIDPAAPGRLQLRLTKRRGPLLEDALSLDATTALGAVLAHRLAQPLPRSPQAQPRTRPPAPAHAAAHTTAHPANHSPPATAPHTAARPPARAPATTLALALDHARAVAVPAPAASAAGRARALV